MSYTPLKTSPLHSVPHALRVGRLCPQCGSLDFVVHETRPVDLGDGIIRRRVECKDCKHRVTTYELRDDALLAIARMGASGKIRQLQQYLDAMSEWIDQEGLTGKALNGPG